MRNTLIWLHEYTEQNPIFHLKNIGGKALPLSILANLKFNVPNAFVINPLFDIDKNKEQILSAFSKLDSIHVAIRSSGINEDGRKKSWAGQFETFLNINSNYLIEKIKECRNYKSSGSIKYGEYLKSNDSHDNSQGVAVIVQKMIKAEYAGVAFTVHPITKENIIYIEACEGYGDKLVSGKIIPITYIMQKETKKIDAPLTHNISMKLLNKLKEEVLRAEKHFQYPCDIEWAIENDDVYILQCRPITT